MEVAEGSLQSGSLHKGWRRDFADPLYLRVLKDEHREDGVRFEMVIAKVPEIFNGDGCAANVLDPMRQPVRKAAVIAIRCTPCVAVDAPQDATPGFDKICSVTREDACTLRVVLSLNCPARETVYAPQLDVGSKPHGDDLVLRGAPTPCVPGAASAKASYTDERSPASMYASLTHGSLAFAAPHVVAQPALPEGKPCRAWALGDGPLALGGEMHATDGPRPLQISCACEDGPAMANVTLTLRLVDYTSPSIQYVQRCPRMAGLG